MHQNRSPLLNGKPENPRPNCHHPFPPHQVLFRRQRSIREIKTLPRLFVLSIHANCIFRTLVLRIPRVVNRQIGCDPIQPCRKLRARLIALPRPVYPQKHFLRQILRHSLRARRTKHKMHHRPAVFLHKIPKRVVIPRLHAEHYLSVAKALRRRCRQKSPCARVQRNAGHTRINPFPGRKLCPSSWRDRPTRRRAHPILTSSTCRLVASHSPQAPANQPLTPIP